MRQVSAAFTPSVRPCALRCPPPRRRALGPRRRHAVALAAAPRRHGSPAPRTKQSRVLQPRSATESNRPSMSAFLKCAPWALGGERGQHHASRWRYMRSARKRRNAPMYVHDQGGGRGPAARCGDMDTDVCDERSRRGRVTARWVGAGGGGEGSVGEVHK